MKPPIITVIGSLSFASGCLVVANNVDNLTAGSRMLERIATENADAPLVFSQLLACLEVAWPVLLMVSLAGATVAWLAEKRLLACVLLLVPLLSTVYALSRLPRPQPSDLWFQRNAGNIECICRVDSVKNKNSLICSSLEMSFPSHRPLSGKTLVTIYGDSQEKQTFEPGQTIAVFGRVTQPGKEMSAASSSAVAFFQKLALTTNTLSSSDSPVARVPLPSLALAQRALTTATRQSIIQPLRTIHAHRFLLGGRNSGSREDRRSSKLTPTAWVLVKAIYYPRWCSATASSNYQRR